MAETLGEKIKELRLSKAFSIEKLEELTGKDKETLLKYEENLLIPGIKSLFKLAQAFDVPKEELLKEEYNRKTFIPEESKSPDKKIVAFKAFGKGESLEINLPLQTAKTFLEAGKLEIYLRGKNKELTDRVNWRDLIYYANCGVTGRIFYLKKDDLKITITVE